MKKILPLLMLLLASGVYAQDTTGKKPVDTNSVIIHKDPRLDLLVKKQAQINEVTSIISQILIAISAAGTCRNRIFTVDPCL